MFKKMFKGIYIVAFLLFVAGFFCLFPIGNNKNEIENSTSQTEAAGDLPSTGPSIVEPMAAKQSTTSYYGIDKSKIYLISSPSDLAWVAHAINNSSSTSLIKNNGLGYYFIQTQDIDLKNEMWTPIGTEKNPFQGIYYGEGYKISNIDIHSSAAATYIGLFGKTFCLI